MPVRRKAKVSYSTGQEKEASTGTNRYSRKTCTEVKSQAKKAATERLNVTALKENNKSLATALDESRHDFRKLQAKYVNLQQERQQLLEKIASLETRMARQNLVSVQPACDFLEQAVKDISSAKKHLRQITEEDPAILVPPPSPILAENTMAVLPNAYSEANLEQHGSAGRRKLYLGTPNASCTQSCLPLNSTPTQAPKMECKLALDFEDTLPEPEWSASTMNVSSVKDHVSEKRTGARPCRKCGVSESKDSGHITISRPQRRCTTISISYQEPDLKRRLTDGSVVNSSLSASVLRGSKESAIPKPTRRRALQDISNTGHTSKVIGHLQ